MAEIHVETPEEEPKTAGPTAPDALVDAAVDQAKELGHAVERLNALEAAHVATGAAYEDTKNVLEGLGARVDALANDMAALVTKHDEVLRRLEEAAEDIVSGPEEIPPPTPEPNVAKPERGFFGKLADALNLH